MSAYNIAEAKAQLSRLVDEAEAGQPVEIMRRGRPVARLVPITPERGRIDVGALKALTDSLPPQPGDAAAFVRGLRDDARY